MRSAATWLLSSWSRIQYRDSYSISNAEEGTLFRFNLLVGGPNPTPAKDLLQSLLRPVFLDCSRKYTRTSRSMFNLSRKRSTALCLWALIGPSAQCVIV